MSELNGFTVGITADRRGEDQAVMFRRLGAEVVLGPTMGTFSVPDQEDLRRRTESVIADPPDFFIASTGLGVRTWMTKAAEWGLEDDLRDALDRTRIAARGPKAVGALGIAGLDVWWRAPREQLDEVIDHLLDDGVEGRRVALQLHGDDGGETVARLESAGAEVLTVPVYRWSEPKDLAASLQLIEGCCDGSIDAVTFTAGPQVRNMVALADREGAEGRLLEALNGRMVVGCIGPVSAAVALEEGIVGPVVPDKWRLGALVRAVTDALVASPSASASGR